MVWQRIALDLRFEDIARNLNIAVGTAYNIFKLFQDTGEVNHKKPPKREHKLDSHHELYILGFVFHYPSLQLSEIVDRVEEISGTRVSTSTLCRLLATYGFTRKKVQRVALQRRVDLRGSYMASVYTFSIEMFVFIDETGSKLKDMLRAYGYALCGSRAVRHQLEVRGQNITTLAAISTEGLLAIDITSSKVNAEIFLDFLRGSLIPELCPFDGYNPRSIIIMDNCSIHRVQEVTDLLNSVGVLSFFLPPYSPDYNPIELAFSYIKHYLREHEDIIHHVTPTHLIQSAFNSLTPELCTKWIQHCGY